MTLNQLLLDMNALRSSCVNCTGLTDLSQCVTCTYEVEWQKLNVQAQALVSAK